MLDGSNQRSRQMVNSNFTNSQKEMSKGHKKAVLDSMNSLDYSEQSIRLMLNKKIKELKLEMPPTRDGLARLFEAINLYATTVTCIDCLLFCRGHKLEKSNPEDFNIDKLIQWFTLNIRTLKHISYEGID